MWTLALFFIENNENNENNENKSFGSHSGDCVIKTPLDG